MMNPQQDRQQQMSQEEYMEAMANAQNAEYEHEDDDEDQGEEDDMEGESGMHHEQMHED